MRSQTTLIRLRGCPGWSESSLVVQVILKVLSCAGSYVFCGEIKHINFLLFSWQKYLNSSFANTMPIHTSESNIVSLYWLGKILVMWPFGSCPFLMPFFFSGTNPLSLAPFGVSITLPPPPPYKRLKKIIIIILEVVAFFWWSVSLCWGFTAQSTHWAHVEHVFWVFFVFFGSFFSGE